MTEIFFLNIFTNLPKNKDYENANLPLLLFVTVTFVKNLNVLQSDDRISALDAVITEIAYRLNKDSVVDAI